MPPSGSRGIGAQLVRTDESGWSHALVRPGAGSAVPRGPLTGLRRVFAVPEAVADVAHALVTGGFGGYARQWHEEWGGAREVCGDRGVPAGGWLSAVHPVRSRGRGRVG